ncbi:MAG: hypothetical protein ACHREM_03010 [Polyangiales bacterium]
MRRVRLSCVALATWAWAAACNPVHNQAVAALGGETPGVPKGPTHRAGEPCLTCHDGSLGDPSAFTVAGTIYIDADSKSAAVGAKILLTSIDGSSYTATTNSVGNFYVQSKQFTPNYPMSVTVTYEARPTTIMVSHVGRDGSCADCHTDPAGPSSAGHVFVPANGVTP